MINLIKIYSIQQFKKREYLYKVFLFFISVIVLSLCYLHVQKSYITHTPTVNYIRGAKAIQENISKEKPITGKIDDLRWFFAYKESVKLASKKNKTELDYQNLDSYAPFANSLFMVSANYIKYLKAGKLMEFKDIDRNSIKSFYHSRSINQKEYYSNILKIEPQKLNYMLKKEDQVKKPFYYQTIDGIDSFIQNYDIIILILLINIIILSSNSFANIINNNEKSVIRTTKYGRKELNKVILLFHNIMNIIYFTLAFNMIYNILLFYLEPTAIKTSIQFLYIFSPAPDTISTYIVKMYFTGLISTICITNITLYFSLKIKNLIYINFIMAILVILPMVVSKFYLGSPSIDLLLSVISPSNAMRLYPEYVVDYNLIRIGEVIIPLYKLMMIWNIILSSIFIFKILKTHR